MYLKQTLLATTLFMSVASGALANDEPANKQSDAISITGYAVVNVGDVTLNSGLSNGTAHDLRKHEVGTIGTTITTDCAIPGSKSFGFCKITIDQSKAVNDGKKKADYAAFRAETYLMKVDLNSSETVLVTNFGDKPVRISVHNLFAN